MKQMKSKIQVIILAIVIILLFGLIGKNDFNDKLEEAGIVLLTLMSLLFWLMDLNLLSWVVAIPMLVLMQSIIWAIVLKS